MKILFVLLYLYLPSQGPYNHFYNDETCYLTEIEKQELEQVAVTLRAKTGVKIIYVCHKKKVGDASYHNGRLVIYLDEDPKERSIQSRQNAMFLKQDYLDQLAIQFLRQGQRDKELVSSVSFLCADIERLWDYRKQLAEKSKEVDQGDEMSSEFWWVIKTYCFLLVIYGTWVAIKWNNKAHNKAEYWEHYGYSRFSVGLRYPLWVLVFIGYVVILNSFVYYFSEIFILLIPLAFLMRPTVMLVSAVISMILDWRTEIQVQSDAFAKASLGQKCFILDPKKETEELILLDILEMVISKAIILTPQLKDGRYGTNRFDNFLSINIESSNPAISLFQHEIVIQLSEGKQHKIPNELIENLLNEIGSFKEIRKDLFMRDLVRLGLISKKSWILNQFTLTDKGVEYKKTLSDLVEKMNTMLKESFSDTSVLNDVQREVFLIKDFEKEIEELYIHLIDKGGYPGIAKSEIAPVLEQSFSFYEFRSAIKRQINKIHRSYMVDEESQMGVD